MTTCPHAKKHGQDDEHQHSSTAIGLQIKQNQKKALEETKGLALHFAM